MIREPWACCAAFAAACRPISRKGGCNDRQQANGREEDHGARPASNVPSIAGMLGSFALGGQAPNADCPRYPSAVKAEHDAVERRPAQRLRPSNEIVVAGPVRERRGVAIIDRMQPKPVAPNSNHHAVIVIVTTPHGVALSEGAEMVRVGIHSGDLHYPVRLGLVPGPVFGQNPDQALGSRFPARLLVGPRTRRSRCGARPCALKELRKK
jgi:hypothetical protein